MKNKTVKSISKRFKVTKNKKILKRYCGQDHFNSRESGNKTRKKRRDTGVHKGYHDVIKKSVLK